MGVCSAKQKPKQSENLAKLNSPRNSQLQSPRGKEDSIGTLRSARKNSAMSPLSSPSSLPGKSKYHKPKRQAVHMKPYLYLAKDNNEFSRFYTILPPDRVEYDKPKIFKSKHDLTIQLVQHNVAATIHELIVFRKDDPVHVQFIQYLHEKQPLHQNIIQFQDLYQCEEYYYLVCENILRSQRLDQYLDENPQLNEVQVANIIYQIISAIDCLHERSLIHSSICPEAFQVVTAKNHEIQIKITQLLDIADPHKLNFEQIFYLSPEEAKFPKPTKQRDIWAIGIIMYKLLHGRLPFNPSSDSTEIQEQIYNLKINYETAEITEVQKECRLMLQAMLAHDPHLRQPTSRLLKHDWFKHTLINQESLKATLSEFGLQHKLNFLQSSIFLYIIHRYYNNLIVPAKLIFDYVDQNSNGFINERELLAQYNAILPAEEAMENAMKVQQQMETLDIDEDGFIDFNDFLLGIIDRKQIVAESTLHLIFNELADNKNRVSVDRLLNKFTTPKKYYKNEEIISKYKSVQNILIIVNFQIII